MKKIKYPFNGIIHFEKIDSFVNICKVTGKTELCNVEIIYRPNVYILEIGSYREFFHQQFNMYIEELCEYVFEHINTLINPKELKVIIYLTEENKDLTPWTVTKEL